MKCHHCQNDIKENQKFLVPVILGIIIVAFIVLVIGIIYFYPQTTDVSIENNTKEEQIEQPEVETSKKEPMTVKEKLYLIDEYQTKYFRIIKRNDVLLQVEDNDNSKQDMEELNELFSEVKNKITNKNYLNKYNEIEECFSENTGENTYDMNRFASENYKAIDSLLNEVYQAVKTKIPQEDFKNLTKSEIKWLKDVESYKSVFDSKDFGTIGSTIYTYYEINMRSFRTLLLMLYL